MIFFTGLLILFISSTYFVNESAALFMSGGVSAARV